jgi:ribosome-associated toxin RatA of RatAB toxin-antitoxin module
MPALAMPVEASGALQNFNSKIKETSVLDSMQSQTADGKTYQITSTIINAAPEDVFAILVDYKRSGLLFKNLTKSEVVSRDENTKTSNVSFSLKGIMNLWSFDYVLAIKENFPSSIEFHRVSGAFKRNEGYWKLLPLDNGRRTEVVYGKFIDAGSIVPPQLVAKEVRESTASVVENLKKVAESPNLKIASHH